MTPYEFFATQKWARKDKDKRLLLGAMGEDPPADLLAVLEAGLTSAPSSRSSDGSRSTSCVHVARSGDLLEMVFACDISGERETIFDGSQEGRPHVFTKGEVHISRVFSVCLLWRPPAGTDGVLLLHSPWGRGGSKIHILNLMQRAVNAASPDPKAKLHAFPTVPQAVMERLLRQAKASRITYLRGTGVTSEFAKASGKQTARAEMALVVKGSDTIPFRDALTSALTAEQNKQKFFTVSVRDADGNYQDEQFEDVEIAIPTGSGHTTYSVRNDTMPKMGFTLGLNSTYFGLPDDDRDSWPRLLADGARTELRRILRDVAPDS
ncbi:MAG: hypothetical protein AAGC53_14015 [Actinomycetota bacterium]